MQTTRTTEAYVTATRVHPAGGRETAAGKMPRTGRAIGAVVAIFLLFDGAARLVRMGAYVEGTVQFGYPDRLASWIGLSLLVSTILYLIPRTAVLGAILVTGYLGGAAAAHVRVEDAWFLFPIVLAALAWGGLYLRDARVSALLPLRRPRTD